jgi:hypothetical protein
MNGSYILIFNFLHTELIDPNGNNDIDVSQSDSVTKRDNEKERQR